MVKKIVLLLVISLVLVVGCSRGGGCSREGGEIVDPGAPSNTPTSTPTVTPTSTPIVPSSPDPTIGPPEPVLLDSHLSLSGYGGKRIYGDLWAAQVFRPLEDWDVRSVKIRVWIEGAVSTFRLELVEVENGLFGEVLNSQTVEALGLVMVDPGSWVEILLSSTLEANQEYALVVSLEEGEEFATVRWIYDSGGSGGAYYSDNGGEEWYQVVDRDFAFEIWGVEADV